MEVFLRELQGLLELMGLLYDISQLGMVQATFRVPFWLFFLALEGTLL